MGVPEADVDRSRTQRQLGRAQTAKIRRAPSYLSPHKGGQVPQGRAQFRSVRGDRGRRWLALPAQTRGKVEESRGQRDTTSIERPHRTIGLTSRRSRRRRRLAIDREHTSTRSRAGLRQRIEHPPVPRARRLGRAGSRSGGRGERPSASRARRQLAERPKPSRVTSSRCRPARAAARSNDDDSSSRRSRHRAAALEFRLPPARSKLPLARAAARWRGREALANGREYGDPRGRR